MTDINRRNILKSFGAMPLAAAIATPLAAQAVEAAETTSQIVNPKYPYLWYMSNDGERYHLIGETTREGALEEAQCSEYTYIAECQQQDFDLTICGDEILERLAECNGNDERMGEDGEFLSCSEEDSKALGDVLTAAIYAWAKERKIKLTSWSFANVRNEEPVALPEPNP